jgi:hypothetical protein
MKAVRRLFKRNKNRQQQQQQQHQQQSVSQPQLAQAPGETKPPAVPRNRSILKSTPPVDTPTPDLASGQSSNTLTARSDSLATRNASIRKSAVELPALVPEKRTSNPGVTPSTKNEESTDKTNKAPSQKTVPSTSATTGPSKRHTMDQEKGTYKGVSESFKKGMTVTQRFGVGETTEDRSSPDVNMLGKLGDAYDSIPLLEQTKLPRGGISMETKAVGRIQVCRSLLFGVAYFAFPLFDWTSHCSLTPA